MDNSKYFRNILTLLFVDVSDNCTAEAINSSLLNLLDNQLSLRYLFEEDTLNIKIINHLYTSLYFLDVKPLEHNIKTIKDLFTYVMNIKVHPLIKINTIKIIKNFLKPMFYEIQNIYYFQYLFFRIIKNVIRHTLVFSYILHYLNPSHFIHTSIPISVFKKNYLLKKWILTCSLGKRIKLEYNSNVPSDPLGISFLSLFQKNKYFLNNSWIMSKVGYGINIEHFNYQYSSKSIWLKKNNSYGLKFQGRLKILKTTIFMNVNSDNLKKIFKFLKNRNFRFCGVFVSTNNNTFMYKLDVFSTQEHVNDIIRNVFIYGFCYSVYIQSVYKYSILENDILINLPENPYIFFRLKEYIFDNKIVAVKVNIADLSKVSSNNPLLFQLNSAKLLIQWENIRLK